MAGRTFTLADAAVAIGADFKAFDRAVDGKGPEVRGKLGKLAAAIKGDFGVTFGAIAGGLTAGAARLGEIWDSAFDTIRTSTGKTGAALEGLQEDLKATAGTVEDSIGTTAQVLADLNKRTGLTGKGLQELTKQELDLARITGTDVNKNVALSTRLFGDWSIATEDQAATLDKVYRASTATGIGVDALMEKVVQFGSPLRLLGFTFEDSIALLGKWEKEGVNTETALSGLKYAVKSLAAEGVPASKMASELRDRIAAIQKSSDPVGDSLKLFGLRAGPDLAAAIKEGRFATQDLLDVINNGTDTIEQATNDTEDLGGKWRKLTNTVSAAIGPMLAGFGDLASTMGPLLYAFPALGGVVGKFFTTLGSKSLAAVSSGLDTLYLKLLYLGDGIKSSKLATSLSDGISGAIDAVKGSSKVNGALGKAGDFMGSKLGKAFGVAFALVAVAEAVQTWFAVKDALDKQSADLLLQTKTFAETASKEQAAAALATAKQQLADLERTRALMATIPGIGPLVVSSSNEARDNLIRVIQELEAAAAGAPHIVSSGIRDHGWEVDNAAKDLASSAAESFAPSNFAGSDWYHAGEAVPKQVAMGLEARQALVQNALTDLRNVMANTLSRGKRIGLAIGTLVSDDLANALVDHRWRVRNAAQKTQADVEQELALMIARGGKVGAKAMEKLRDALHDKNPRVREAAQRVKAIVDQELQKAVKPAGQAGTDAGNAFTNNVRKAVVGARFTVEASVRFGGAAARAAGGPTQAGVPYWVNEDTPKSELIVPGAGHVLTHEDAMAAAAGRGSGAGESGHTGDTYNIPVNVQGALPVRTTRDIVTELRRIGELGLLPSATLSPKYRRREATG